MLSTMFTTQFLTLSIQLISVSIWIQRHRIPILSLLIVDPAAGASDDWYKGGLGTRYAFTTELRDTGYYGFELPPNQIIPSGEELFAGMKVVFNKIIEDAKEA